MCQYESAFSPHPQYIKLVTPVQPFLFLLVFLASVVEVFISMIKYSSLDGESNHTFDINNISLIFTLSPNVVIYLIKSSTWTPDSPGCHYSCQTQPSASWSSTSSTSASSTATTACCCSLASKCMKLGSSRSTTFARFANRLILTEMKWVFVPCLSAQMQLVR